MSATPVIAVTNEQCHSLYQVSLIPMHYQFKCLMQYSLVSCNLIVIAIDKHFTMNLSTIRSSILFQIDSYCIRKLHVQVASNS